MIKRMIHCMALPSLVVSVSSVIAGTACAAFIGNNLMGEVHFLKAMLCALCAALFQVSANLTYCYKLGKNNRKDMIVKSFNPDATPNMMLLRFIKETAIMTFALALILGFAISSDNIWLICIGAVFCLVGYNMVGGNRVMSSYPIKMLLDFIMMGPVAVMITTYVQVMHMSDPINKGSVLIPSLIMSWIMGMFAVNCLVAHGYMCYDQDGKYNKRTFTRKYGRKAARAFLACSDIAIAALTVWFFMYVKLPYITLMMIVPAVILLLNLLIVWRLPKINGDNWDLPQNLQMCVMLLYSVVMLVIFSVLHSPDKFMPAFSMI